MSLADNSDSETQFLNENILDGHCKLGPVGVLNNLFPVTNTE